ncbi:MAG: hypothetical protein H7A37_03370 [Chlamydiales bacterium]|nr:hypothetical protein [Chlamydiales bacterium]
MGRSCALGVAVENQPLHWVAGSSHECRMTPNPPSRPMIALPSTTLFINTAMAALLLPIYITLEIGVYAYLRSRIT